MTGAELKTMTETILDDTVDDVFFYQLVNIAKKQVEGKRPWMMLRVLDSTKSTISGNNSETAIDLPSDWSRTYKLIIDKDQPYIQVPFDEQHLYRYSSNRYVVDVANDVYYLLGTLGGIDTIYNYYIKSTPDITSSTSPVWNDYHELIAFTVAGYIMSGVDADDIFARMSPSNMAMAMTLSSAMEAWDMDLQLSAQGGALAVDGASTGLDLSMM